MKKVALILSTALIVYATFFTEKARLDREVNRLCAIDGGIRVYETVKLPAERFDQFGQVSIPHKDNVGPSDNYFYESLTSYLIRGNPKMWRNQYRILRAYDNKFLGESIGYARVGGDLPGPWHSSSYSCPEKVDIYDLKKLIFIRDNNEDE